MRCYYILNIIPYKNYRMNVHLNAVAHHYLIKAPPLSRNKQKKEVS